MFKKLKSLFIIEEEDNNKANPKASATPKASTSASPTSPTPPNPTSKPHTKATPTGSTPQPKGTKPPTGKPDEKFINRLLGALESNNLKGFDYLEYKQSVQSLSSVDMDEPTRFKSALAMAKTMGATPALLLSSADHYIKVLTNEEAKFLAAFNNQQELQVSNLNKEIKRLEEGIAQRKAQVEKLQKEIESGVKALESRKNNINEANAKVQATKDGFYHAYHIVFEQIKEDVEKMKKYLS